jgi:site-specific recombinase XerD
MECGMNPRATALVHVVPSADLRLPSLIAVAGDRAALRFLEYFTVNIRNRNTRAAYARAAADFLGWCEGQGISELGRVQPVHVAAYIERLRGMRSAPTVKQHLACIRMLFDWLVVGQVMPSNPAHSVRGPRHSVSKGSTPVLSSEEATALLTGMNVSTVVGLRDRAIIAVMTYIRSLRLSRPSSTWVRSGETASLRARLGNISVLTGKPSPARIMP